MVTLCVGDMHVPGLRPAERPIGEVGTGPWPPETQAREGLPLLVKNVCAGERQGGRPVVAAGESRSHVCLGAR